MKNKKLIWLIGTKLGEKSVIHRHLSKSYLIFHFENLKTMKNYLSSNECKKPGIYIFAQDEAMKYFCNDGETSIPFLSTIVIGNDHPTDIKVLYSIGLLNYLPPSAKHQLMAQISLMLNGQLERPELSEVNWDNLTVKEKKILGIFSLNKNNQVSREEIINSVWSAKRPDARSFDVHLCNLRKKIKNSPYKILRAGDGKYQFEIGRTKRSRIIKNLKMNSVPIEFSMSLQ